MILPQKKVLFTSLISVLALLSLLSMGVGYWYQHPQKNQQTIVLIEKGSSLSKIAEILSAQNVLEYPMLFKATLYGTASWRDLKAGEYVIPAHVTPAQLIHILKSGDILLHPFTLIEGETCHVFTQKILNDDHFKGLCEVPLEGTLLPETLYFPRGTERKKIVSRFEQAMTRALTEIWSNRAPDHPLKSAQELLVLASIIEKETRIPLELPIVAAVFLNRLKIGMPLQADPTVLYGLTKGQGALGRELARSDLQNENTYNTYLISGLPPSPIANPGLASLRAVAHPADVSYLYFVADGSGGHIFATTLDEHQKNHAKWREIRGSSN